MTVRFFQEGRTWFLISDEPLDEGKTVSVERANGTRARKVVGSQISPGIYAIGKRRAREPWLCACGAMVITGMKTPHKPGCST